VTLHLDRELQDLYEELERAAITRAMIVSRQNQAESARRLGITRKGLYLKRKRLGLADDATADDEPSDRLDE
jgi:DNA-binding NtrC family response regulator